MSIPASLSAASRRLFLSGGVTPLTGVEIPFSGDRALAFSLSEGSADGMLLGGAFSAACSLTLDDSDGALTDHRDLRGASVRVSLTDGETCWPLCVFTAARVVRRENDCRLVLSGSDALGTAFTGAFEDTQTYPRTLGQIASFIAAQAGFPLTADFPNASFSIPAKPDWGDVSLRQALAFVACACGCFSCVDREGGLVFRPVWPDETSYALPAAMTLQREYGGAVFGPLTGLAVSPFGAPRGESPLTVTLENAPISESAALTVSENPLFPYGGAHTQALAESLLLILSGMTQRRCALTWRGDPAVAPGTRLSVTDSAGNTEHCLVTAQTLTFFQGFSMATDCLFPASPAAVGRVFTAGGALNASRLSGSLNGVLIRDGTVSARAIAAGSVTALHLAAQSVTADKLAAGAVSAGAIAAVKADVESLSAGQLYAGIAEISKAQLTTANIDSAQIAWADITALRAAAAGVAAAEIGEAKIGYGQIYDLTADAALITKGSANRFFFDRLAVNSAQMVDLTVGQFTVKARDGGYYQLNVDLSTGLVTASPVTVTASELAAGETSSGRHIIETSFTAAELTTASATATEALINKLTAARVDADTLFAREAVLHKLEAMDLTGNQYLRLLVNSRSKNWSQYTDPALDAGNTPLDGDIWNKTAGLRTWQDLTDLSWQRLGSYPWGDLTGSVQYIRKDGQWQLMADDIAANAAFSEIRLLQDALTLRVSRAEGDLQNRYVLQSGVDITPEGVVVSGGSHVRIRAGGAFTVESGNFAIDAQGNVSVTGTVTAAAGSIGGWTLGPAGLYGGAGSAYVQLCGDAQSDYALFAGAESAAAAPFRVKRDGSVYLTKLIALDENNAETNVNLRTAGLWKLGTANVKNASVSGNTLTIQRFSGGDLTVNFNTAASVTLAGAWSGVTFTITASNGQTRAESLTVGTGLGNQTSGGRYTIDSFDSAHLAYGSVNADSAQNGRLITFNVDASGEYDAGYEAGWNACLDACVSGTYYTGAVGQAYDPVLDVWYLVVKDYDAVTRYEIPSRMGGGNA